jgi:hypothetical protein
MALSVLNLSTGWSFAVSFTSQPLYPRERAPITWTTGFMDPRVGLDAVTKGKVPSLLGLEPDHPPYNLVTILTIHERLSFTYNTSNTSFFKR